MNPLDFLKSNGVSVMWIKVAPCYQYHKGKLQREILNWKSVFLPESFCALTKTLPFRLSLDFDSEPERPKLNIDFHFLDLVDNFLLEGKRAQEVTKP